MKGRVLKIGAKKSKAGEISEALRLAEDEIRLVTCHMATGVMNLKAQDRLAWLHDQLRCIRYAIEAEAKLDRDRTLGGGR